MVKEFSDLYINKDKKKHTLTWKRDYNSKQVFEYIAKTDEFVLRIYSNAWEIPWQIHCDLTYKLSVSHKKDFYHIILLGTMEECKDKAQKLIDNYYYQYYKEAMD